MKRMVALLVCWQMILTSCAQKKETFDIVTYTAPQKWSRDQKAETLTFTKERGSHFCMMTIYKSIAAGNDADTNFTMAWQSLVQENLGVASQPTMQPESTDNGWETKTGSAAFDKSGITGVALLISSSQENKLVNILVLTNTGIFQKEMEGFLASVVLQQKKAGSNTDTAPAAVQAADKVKDKPELWVGRRLTYLMNSSTEANPKTVTDFFVIYPNGDYLQHVPYQGLATLDKSYATESWGKFTLAGAKGRFKNKYDEIAVTKKSATHMEKDGYSYGLYKCLDVDNLRIEGAYTHVSPDWGKDPALDYLHNPGCQFVIYFKKDGTFDDRGIFYSGGDPNTSNCPGGKGTYSIERFTITFRYNDGRIVNRLFSAPPTRDPASYDKTIYIGHTGYYKKQ